MSSFWVSWTTITITEIILHKETKQISREILKGKNKESIMTNRFPQGLPLEKRGDSVYHPDRICVPQGTITFLWAASLTAINKGERRPSLVAQMVKNLPAKEAGVDP